MVATHATDAGKARELVAVGKATDEVAELQSRITADTALGIVLKASIDDAFAVAERKRGYTAAADSVGINTSEYFLLTVVVSIQEEGLAAGSTNSVLVLDATHVFLAAGAIRAQKLIIFADQANLDGWISAAPTTSHQSSLAGVASL